MQNLVQNADLLLKRFGEWPSFHDSEVIEAKFCREGKGGPSLTIRVFVFETTNKVGPDKCFVRAQESIVDIRFDGIRLTSFEGFGVQNVLWDLLISQQVSEAGEKELLVELPTSYGLSASLVCQKCTVEKIEPYAGST